MPKNPIVLAAVSDIHAGSSVGLCPPVVNLDDGGTYRTSKAQSWLWECWLDYCGQVEARADKLGANICAVVNGDAIEGNHHRTLQVISANETTQMRIAYKSLEPLVNIADDLYMMRGTPAHVAKSARLEEKLADDITIIMRESEHAATWWHLQLDVHGILFDIAHHGSLGRLPWTQANSANRIAAQIIVRAIESKQRPPDVVIRSHLHRYADTGQNFNTIRVIATPAWQLITGYVNRLNPGELADIGGLIFTCWPNGNYDYEVVRYQPEPGEPVKVEYG
jgi:hypothetical protein